MIIVSQTRRLAGDLSNVEPPDLRSPAKVTQNPLAGRQSANSLVTLLEETTETR